MTDPREGAQADSRLRTGPPVATKPRKAGLSSFGGKTLAPPTPSAGGVPGGVGGAGAMCLNKNGYVLFVCRDAEGRKSLLRSTNVFAGSCSQPPTTLRRHAPHILSRGRPDEPPGVLLHERVLLACLFLFFFLVLAR